jgi:hypothetical protein
MVQYYLYMVALSCLLAIASREVSLYILRTVGNSPQQLNLGFFVQSEPIQSVSN